MNYSNSVLGSRSNRNSGGIEMLCNILGKAPHFGLMTDEGRKAKWLIEVKTTDEPQWSVLGEAKGSLGEHRGEGRRVDSRSVSQLRLDASEAQQHQHFTGV